MKKRTIPKQAFDIVKEFEGLSLVAYPDPGTGGKPYTVGYGHTTGVFKDTHIDSDFALKLLRIDLENAAAPILEKVKVPLNDNQFSALLSFVFNVGAGNFSGSTLLKKLNEGLYEEAASEFLKWNKAAKKVLPGLTRRRAAERELFLKPSEPSGNS